MEPQYNKDMVPGEIQMVQTLIPGPPDPPEIYVKHVGLEEFVIEWGEPRLYGVRVDGYQVILNGKKVGTIMLCFLQSQCSYHTKCDITNYS